MDGEAQAGDRRRAWRYWSSRRLLLLLWSFHVVLGHPIGRFVSTVKCLPIISLSVLGSLVRSRSTSVVHVSRGYNWV